MRNQALGKAGVEDSAPLCQNSDNSLATGMKEHQKAKVCQNRDKGEKSGEVEDKEKANRKRQPFFLFRFWKCMCKRSNANPDDEPRDLLLAVQAKRGRGKPVIIIKYDAVADSTAATAISTTMA